MKRLWKWLAENSSQLQGLAAVAAILAGLAAVPFFVSRWLQPEVTIKVTADPATVPPALEGWIREATLVIKTLPSAPEDDADLYRSLRGLQATGPLDPIRRESFYQQGLDHPGCLRVDVVNGADRVIPGARLRLDRAYPVWGVTLAATFLTAEEVTAWQKGLSVESAGPQMVLPELPPIPPRSAVTIIAYGDVSDAEVSATVPGTSFRLVPTVRIEDKWPVSLILRPYWLMFLPLPLGLAALAIVAGLTKFERTVWRRARKHVSYDLACGEAKTGRKESALALLHEAVAAGYDDFRHMLSDPDLEGLRETEAFKKLVGS